MMTARVAVGAVSAGWALGLGVGGTVVAQAKEEGPPLGGVLPEATRARTAGRASPWGRRARQAWSAALSRLTTGRLVHRFSQHPDSRSEDPWRWTRRHHRRHS